MQEEKSELEKAVELVEKEGHVVIKKPSLVEADPIRELCALLDGAGYRVVSAEIVREAEKRWRGEINLSILSAAKIEMVERKYEW